jgi:predicted membrane protein
MYYFAAASMMSGKRTYNIFQLFSAVFMIAALLWLTISAPFVYAGQQQIAKQAKESQQQSSQDEEAANPFANTTEEKAPSSTSFSEEYLHDQHHTEHFFSISSRFFARENAGLYVAFHGELLVPPPNRV